MIVGYLFRLVVGTLLSLTSAYSVAVDVHFDRIPILSLLCTCFGYAVLTVDPPSAARLSRIFAGQRFDPDPLRRGWERRSAIGSLVFVLSLALAALAAMSIESTPLDSVTLAIAFCAVAAGAIYLLRRLVVAKLRTLGLDESRSS